LYKIKEIFLSIQGEGTYTGMAVIFLRFAGCNRWSGRDSDKEKSICNFCDTDFTGGDSLTDQEIINRLRLRSSVVRDVVLTGGEPMLQVDEKLLNSLIMAGFRIHLETNGCKPLKELQKFFFHISMSPKQTREETLLEKSNDIKILYPWIKEGIDLKSFEDFPHKQAFIQPLWDSNKQDTVNLILQNPKIRISSQLHKYLELR
jgi:7-carboxy-7-deazaguanine synthase